MELIIKNEYQFELYFNFIQYEWLTNFDIELQMVFRMYLNKLENQKTHIEVGVAKQ